MGLKSISNLDASRGPRQTRILGASPSHSLLVLPRSVSVLVMSFSILSRTLRSSTSVIHAGEKFPRHPLEGSWILKLAPPQVQEAESLRFTCSLLLCKWCQRGRAPPPTRPKNRSSDWHCGTTPCPKLRLSCNDHFICCSRMVVFCRW